MSKPSNSPKKIVLADDSVTMHRAVKLGLKKEPFDVICCDNGADAWRIIKVEKPDAVLADLDMPGMTGAELCQKIKADPALKHIPVILVCGSFDQVDEKHLENVPADARLWKPFETQVLTAILNKVLGPSSSGSEATAQIRTASEATAAIPTHRPPPPPPSKSRTTSAERTEALQTKTQTAFEATTSQHVIEPEVGGRTMEMPEVREPAQNLFEGFQDIPFSENESVASTNNSYVSEATAAMPREAAEATAQQDSYENLWATDLPATPTGNEATQMQPAPAAVRSGSEPTAVSAEAWPSFDDSEKSFSNEVFEAVESRIFENEDYDSQADRSAEATEVIGNLRDSADPTQHSLPKTDLQSYREETSHAFPPQPKETIPTQPSLPRPSLVEHTSALATSMMAGPATKPGLSEDEVRKIIREEIQTAIGGWLKNRLQEELDRVIEEIDRE